MNKINLCAICVALLISQAHADTVGLYLGSQIWQSDATGVLGEQSEQLDFNFKKDTQFNTFIAVEHPYPFLPNVRVSHTSVDTSGSITLEQDFSFGAHSFTTGSKVNANYHVSYFDYTLYYELLDSELISFEFGLTIRDFNGDVNVTEITSKSNDTCNDPNPSPDSPCSGQGNTAQVGGKITTDLIDPMLYVGANISLPVTGLSVFAQGDFVLKTDHTIYDYQIGLNYLLIKTRMIDLNLTLGYQFVTMNFEDLNNLHTDLDFKGVFVGAVAHF